MESDRAVYWVQWRVDGEWEDFARSGGVHRTEESAAASAEIVAEYLNAATRVVEGTVE